MDFGDVNSLEPWKCSLVMWLQGVDNLHRSMVFLNPIRLHHQRPELGGEGMRNSQGSKVQRQGHVFIPFEIHGAMGKAFESHGAMGEPPAMFSSPLRFMGQWARPSRVGLWASLSPVSSRSAPRHFSAPRME